MGRPNFSHIQTHVFRGKRFRIEWRRPANKPKRKNWVWHGECDPDKRRILVNPDSDLEECLFTTLHESIHACFPDLDDESVDAWEQDAARLARRMGLKVKFEPRNPKK